MAFSCTFSERRLDEQRNLNCPRDRIKLKVRPRPVGASAEQTSLGHLRAGVVCSQLFESDEIPRNQGFLLGACPSLQLPFPVERGATIGVSF